MLTISGIVKKFGSFTAVKNVSLEVKPGELYGFLGPNGAGKTTTIKMITGLYSPSSGTIEIDGHDIADDPVAAKQLLGYIPDQPFLYNKLSGREFLYFCGGLYDIEKDILTKKIEEVVDYLGIGNWLDKRTEEYSQGMKQRITIASALLHNPKLVIIDEPMVGLDPQSGVIVKNLFRKLTSEGTAIFMSTHSLPVAEEICSRIGIIKDGELIFEGTRNDVEIFMSENNKNFESMFLELTT